jgi:hypothetical protein
MALIMILKSPISDVGRCCKWVENRSQFRSSNAELGVGDQPPQEALVHFSFALGAFTLPHHPSQSVYSIKGAENSSDHGVVNGYSSRPSAPACGAFNQPV